MSGGAGGARKQKLEKFWHFLVCIQTPLAPGSGGLSPRGTLKVWYFPKLRGVTEEPLSGLSSASGPFPLITPEGQSWGEGGAHVWTVATEHKSVDCTWHILCHIMFKCLNFVTQLQASKNICFYYYWWNKGVKLWFITDWNICYYVINGS